MFVTFLLSAAAHELVMAVVTKKIRMYLFTMQLIQIPLIAVGRTPAIKRNKSLGNVVFWLGLYAGFPLLCVAYVLYCSARTPRRPCRVLHCLASAGVHCIQGAITAPVPEGGVTRI
ncbi:hypothetical protein EDB85DRAFT_345122 [Lactarius pseudohatsudake]|nr:hypothetical protein EDB85DRAFT_345122 [Lactarius pseudohatsudake]